MGLHVGNDALREGAGVEAIGTVAGDGGQGGGEAGVADTVPQAFRAAIGAAIEGDAIRGEGEFAGIGQPAIAALVGGEHAGDVRADDPAIAGEADGALEQIAPGFAAETGMGEGEGAEDARRGDGAVAEFVGVVAHAEAEAVGAFAFEICRPHIGRGRGRTGGQAVDDFVPAGAAVVDVDDAEAADAAHQRVHHALGEGTGQHSINRVAPGGEHGGAGFHRLRLRGDDHGGGFGEGAEGAGHFFYSTREERGCSFCGQKEPKKLFINALASPYTIRWEYAVGKEVSKFFCFFVFKQRRAYRR